MQVRAQLGFGWFGKVLESHFNAQYACSVGFGWFGKVLESQFAAQYACSVRVWVIRQGAGKPF
jgi:hypothetical protein